MHPGRSLKELQEDLQDPMFHPFPPIQVPKKNAPLVWGYNNESAKHLANPLLIILNFTRMRNTECSTNQLPHEQNNERNNSGGWPSSEQLYKQRELYIYIYTYSMLFAYFGKLLSMCPYLAPFLL